MKPMRKVFSAVLTLSMVLAAFSGTAAFAASDDLEDSYEVEKGVITEIKQDYYSGNTKNINVPSKIKRTITEIGDGDGSVLDWDASDRRIYLPSTVRKINDSAFQNAKFKSISMDEGVEEIGEDAFAGAEMTTVNFANSITKMGIGAFSNASNLERVTLPTKLSKVPDSAFEGCDNLETVNLSNVTTIGDSAFADCDDLDEITIPASVTKIGYDAFDEDITIKGYANSTAQKYAKDNDIEFVSLGTSSGSVSLNTTSLSLNAGSTASVTVNNPTAGFYATSSNSNIATVSGTSGNTVSVYGVNAGTATITVSASGYASATLTVNVSSSGSASTYVQLDTVSYSFNVGNVYYVLARTNSASVPSCTSSNSGVVAVQYQADRSNRSDLRGSYSHAYLYQIRGTSTGSATVTIGGTATLPVTVSTSPYGSVIPDKSVNFGLAKGSYYEVRMTVNGTTNAPNFTVGNGSVLKTQYVGKSGSNTYIYRLWVNSSASAGQKTGVYTTLPGDKAVLHFEGVIANG